MYYSLLVYSLILWSSSSSISLRVMAFIWIRCMSENVFIVLSHLIDNLWNSTHLSFDGNSGCWVSLKHPPYIFMISHSVNSVSTRYNPEYSFHQPPLQLWCTYVSSSYQTVLTSTGLHSEASSFSVIGRNHFAGEGSEACGFQGH